MSNLILSDIKDNILNITLNNPSSQNTLSLDIIKRLYKDYTKRYLNKILLSAVLALILAASTSSVAYLLDPAIKELFINKSETLIFIIPTLIVIAFFIKGISLYTAKFIMIGVAEDIKRDLQNKKRQWSYH